MIISGKAKANTVNWQLTNIVFEGDMSNLKNNFTNPNDNLALCLYGIIYFKNKPYNNSRQDGQSVEGMVKLDKLEGVSSENFKVGFGSTSYSVLDVSGITPNVLDTYNKDNNNQIASKAGLIHAIYVNKDYSSTDVTTLCKKFADSSRIGAIYVYFGNNKVQGNFYNSSIATVGASRIPRTLKEFEYFGNYDKFEKSAKSSYTDDEFKALPLQKEQENLERDETTGLTNGIKNQLAQNNKRIEFIDPETQKIIFSVVNDRQYNA